MNKQSTLTCSVAQPQHPSPETANFLILKDLDYPKKNNLKKRPISHDLGERRIIFAEDLKQEGRCYHQY